MTTTTPYTDYPPSLRGEYAMGAAIRHLRAADESVLPYLVALERLQYDPTRPDAMSSWINDHDSQWVHTIQIRVDALHGDVRQVWSPPKRNAIWGPTYAKFFENGTQFSRRDYRGIQSLRSDDTTFIGWDASMHTLIIYIVDGGE